jgi:hypothetical protein
MKQELVWWIFNGIGWQMCLTLPHVIKELRKRINCKTMLVCLRMQERMSFTVRRPLFQKLKAAWVWNSNHEIRFRMHDKHAVWIDHLRAVELHHYGSFQKCNQPAGGLQRKQLTEQGEEVGH